MKIKFVCYQHPDIELGVTARVRQHTEARSRIRIVTCPKCIEHANRAGKQGALNRIGDSLKQIIFKEEES